MTDEIEERAEGARVVRLLHPEASTALSTRRPEVLKVLRARLTKEAAPGEMTLDVDLLLNALELAVIQIAESEHRNAEVSRVLRDQRRVFEGLVGQCAALREVLERGGTYQNAIEREKASTADD